MGQPIVAFDLDGTLVDSVLDIAAAANQVLKALGLEQRTTAQYRQWVGNGVAPLLARAITNRFDGKPATELLDRALARFEEAYVLTNGRSSAPYPHAGDILTRLQGNAHLACVTNKPYAFAVELLRHHGLLNNFALVVGGDTVAPPKPHPAPLHFVVEHFGGRVDDLTLVGDSVNDVRAAKAAGCRVIAVSYGYNHGLDIRDESPDHVIDSLSALAHLLS